MLKKILKSKVKRQIAKFMLVLIIMEIFAPLRVLALTAGPSQPEMQSFEPVGTTDLVDPFSGDFNYNIPLLDVEGYPINIAYHSGINMDQEASWVGLGWNINPGNISHNVRGIPDDFDGDVIEKDITINPELAKKVSVFAGGSAEIFGFKIPINASLGMNFNNYSGISSNFNIGTTLSYSSGSISTGVNLGLGVSTDQGADFDYSVSLSKKSSLKNGVQNTVTGSFGQQFNSRQGLMASTFGVSSTGKKDEARDYLKTGKKAAQKIGSGSDYNTSYTPISLSNFVPVITNAAFTNSTFFQLKIGGELSGGYAYAGINIGLDKTEFMQNGNRNAFGYLNLEHAKDDDIVDFTRDRDGRFNRKMKYLPAGNMTYDVYSVSGQGTAGSFRPFRSDVGSVYDPYTTSENQSYSVRLEAGLGTLLELGADFTDATTHSESGPWKDYQKRFNSKNANELFEPYYFKQSGELTLSQMNDNSNINNAYVNNYHSAIKEKALLKGNDFLDVKNYNTHTNDFKNYRHPRANLLYFHNATDASNPNISLMPAIENYTTAGSMSHTTIARNAGGRKSHHISEITQLLPDGRRYVYGIPAMNIEQVEYVASVNATGLYGAKIEGNISGIDPSVGVETNPDLGQKFHMKSKTPAHAHSYLLTSVLSSDYSDLTGDGITDDDLGEFTKFNYSLMDGAYKWRTPYATGSGRLDIGVRSDCHDDKATVVMGKKEIWMLHSIESRNYIAEFYISTRADGKGSDDPLISGGGNNYSYKLDKIVLYNKKDRQQNGANAFPIKTVLFTYDYSLCKGVPNKNANGDVGKLTLKSISIKNGTSDIGLLSPYRFEYGKDFTVQNGTTVNPDYDERGKDVWGEYKSPTTGNNGLLDDMSNHEFPYVNQSDPAQNDLNAFAWNLTRITVPSGGKIDVKYESDDYAYVQDKRAMEMFKIEGAGFSDNFDAGNALYQSATNPALYLYFKRKIGSELVPGDIEKSYLQGIQSVQYNFEVVIDGASKGTESCGIPLVDNIKGYADIESSGICQDINYAYIKIKPKYADKTGSLLAAHPAAGSNTLILNPISVSAIHYAQYYNNKALNPASEIANPNVAAILQQLITAFGEYANYVRNPMIAHINKNLAKEFHIGRSYMRLQSQGFKKGGGHRVKRVTSTDAWDVLVSGSPVAVYGSEYDYTTKNDDGKLISSGVASYEPLLGGDENPCRNRVHTDRIGNSRVFPMTEPIELIVEEPLGESLFPSASVGYSKVTIKSIHKDVGKSSQIIQQQEFYTAKDFPVDVKNSDIELWQNEYPKKINFQRIKKDILRAAQSYVITLNDMHGKQKANRTFVDKGSNILQEVSHTYYNYFSDIDPVTKKMGLKNDQIPCAIFNNNSLAVQNKELGVEVDFTMDNREKFEKTRSWGLNINTNTLLFGAIPIPIPMPIPQIPRGQDKIFSSVVATKIIQKYGILKSVETFDKGATVVMENSLYDPYTGQAILTRVNTEHNDAEYNFKNPAYWAYNGLGPAYENILYEEEISAYGDPNSPADPDFMHAKVVNDSCFIFTDHPERFNVGDELTFRIKNSCQTVQGGEPEEYKLWIVDKNTQTPVLPKAFTCECENPASPAYPIYFTHMVNCKVPHSSTFVDYSNLSNNGFATECKYYNAVSNVFTDKICNLPYDKLIDYNSFYYTPYGDIAKYFNLSEVLNIPALENLKKSLSATDPYKYPLEYMKSSWEHDGDYAEQGNDPNLEPVFTPLELGLGNANLICNPSVHPPNGTVSNKASLVHGAPHDYETPHSKATPFVYEGKIVDNTLFSNIYGSKPKLYSTSHTLNVNVSVFIDVIMNIRQNGVTIKTIHIQDPNNPVTNPFSVTENNFFQRDFSFVFPYDANTPPLSYQVLNQPMTTFKTLPTGTYYSLVRFPKALINNNMIYYFNECAAGLGYEYNFDVQFKYTSSAEVKPRASQEYQTNAKPVLVAVPLKREALSSTGTHKPWPKFDKINDATVRVIRSGKRNRLTEYMQEMTALQSPFAGGALSGSFSYDKVLNIGATEYTDAFYQPEELNDPAGIYFNQFVTGVRGNYVPYKVFQYHKERDYNAALDKNKGKVSNVPSFWFFGANPDPDKYNQLIPLPYQNQAPWYPKSTVTKYDPWGKDIEVKDASGAIHANIFGYNNRLPVAVVSNSQSDNAVFENFEDYDANYFNQYFVNYTGNPSNWALKYFQNSIRKAIIDGLGSNFSLASSKHTGTKGLQINTFTSVPVKLITGSMIGLTDKPTLFPFHMRTQKYIFNYWQKVGQNAAIPVNGAVRVVIDNTNFYAKAKTPNIDGWVLYEGTVDASAYPTINQADIRFYTTNAENNNASNTIDDLRILPNVSNMKSYVYNPVNKRLVAVLDENHMATVFDYTPEGKLARIKKETERGIITLKESRESLINIIKPQGGGNLFNLSEANDVFTPNAQLPWAPQQNPYNY